MKACRLFFFDLDDTIYDRTPHRFGVALSRVKHHRITDALSRESLLDHIEAIRRLAPMFVELGYASTQARTDRRLFLAGMLLCFAPPELVSGVWNVPLPALERARRFVADFNSVLRTDPSKSWVDFLASELAVRTLLNGSGAAATRQVIDGLIVNDDVVDLAEHTADTASWKSREGFGALWARLMHDGVRCYIASEGEEALQREKLASLGLGDDEYAGTLLTSERASLPLDTANFLHASKLMFVEAARRLPNDIWSNGQAGHLDATTPTRIADHVDRGIARIAACRWMLSTFARKMPGYYARIIHAVVASPLDPGQALDSFAIVPPEAWSRQDVRLAMFGNYHAKDIVPIQQLLGQCQVWTGLLDEGLHRGIEAADASFVPSRLFRSWREALRHIPTALPWGGIEPLRGVRPHADHSTVALIREAPADSSFQVVAKLAEFIEEA